MIFHLVECILDGLHIRAFVAHESAAAAPGACLSGGSATVYCEQSLTISKKYLIVHLKHG